MIRFELQQAAMTMPAGGVASIRVRMTAPLPEPGAEASRPLTITAISPDPQVPDVAALPRTDPAFATAPNSPDGAEFWPYLRDDDTLARPWALPGTPGLEHRIGGIEKAKDTGAVSYDPANHEEMVRTRQAKIDGIVRDGLDFAKTLLRINLADAGSVATLEANAAAVTAAAAARVPIMLEPFMSSWLDGRVTNDLTADAVIKSVAIASGLGESSAYSWLKLPVVDDMERVMAATTLPTLLLGGDPAVDPADTYARWAAALALPGVRGLVVGPLSGR